MPVLPLVDLLILMGSGCLGVGFVLKAVMVTTRYRPTVFGFSSMDFLIIAGICFVFALTLAARTWVKVNEPRLLSMRSKAAAAQARRRQAELEMSELDDAEVVAAAVASLNSEQAAERR